TAMLLGEAPHSRRQAERVEGRDLPRQEAEREGHGPALAESVDAKAGEVGRLVRDVELALGVEGVEPVGRSGGDAPETAVEVLVGELRASLEGMEVTVSTEDRRATDLQVHVAGVELDAAREKEVEIHDTTRFGSEASAL